MIQLIYENEQENYKITDELIEKIKLCMEQTLLSEEFSYDCEISLTFTDNAQIQVINRENRDKDAPTDVLSFPMLETDENGKLIVTEEDIFDGTVILGDIVISCEKALAQAKEYNHSPLREFCFLTVHSMLHLLGYDHERSKEEEQLQFQKQEYVLNLLSITR